MENFGIHLEPLRAILYQVGAFKIDSGIFVAFRLLQPILL